MRVSECVGVYVCGWVGEWGERASE